LADNDRIRFYRMMEMSRGDAADAGGGWNVVVVNAGGG